MRSVVDALQAEVRRLLQELDERDARIEELEAKVRELDGVPDEENAEAISDADWQRLSAR